MLDILMAFCMGVQIALLIMVYAIIIFCAIYFPIKFTFWIYEKLDIKNPFLIIFDWFLRLRSK